MTTVTNHLKLRPEENQRDPAEAPGGSSRTTTTLDIGNGSEVVYILRFAVIVASLTSPWPPGILEKEHLWWRTG
ncbi:hypothetical protein ACH5RR_017637 [Cinchona calisaya]|uniref:Uncharacterized protein n=1 Tax=Cinchona calisaya TaxID=153742 RepID=A0ABD2ZKG2_9GENT